MSFVANLEPQALWQHFDKILAIPRGSGDEAQVRAYVVGLAAARGLPHEVDGAGNVVVRVPATPGHEQAPVTILQGHLDMVNERDSDVAHDFSVDAIRPRQQGEYLTATGTTLGSDNGIGVAAMLALLDAEDVVHGPLELLFTIDEETGLTGANRLEASLLTGRQLINLDSEEEDSVTVGCAGGAGLVLRLTVAREPVSGGTPLRVRLRGLHGGHSGIDIHLQRGNAVKLLARLLHAAVHEHVFRVISLEGGNKHNAIPRVASAELYVESDVAALRAALEAEFAAVRSEFAAREPGLGLELAEGSAVSEAFSAAATVHALHVLEALPHGVLAMSADIAGLVETSTNVATVATSGTTLEIGTSSRSSVGSALRAVQRRLKAIAHLANAHVVEGHGYPGWKPDLASPLLAVVRSAYSEVYGREPELKAVHAGLECGIIGEKVPGMDMVSIGPQIEFPHSPAERVHIASVGRFWELLRAVLGTLAARPAA